MGVQLPAFLGGMQCDVYYCTYTYLDQEPESILVPSGQFQDEFGNPLPQENVVTGGAGQNEYGEAIKVWYMDRTQKKAYWNVMGSVNLQDLSADREFEYKKRLNGRFMGDTDPRVDSMGEYHPFTDMLITNVKDTATGKQLHLNEDGSPVIFEVMSVDPFINPWNEIEYYKLLLERADNQELI